jgi:hypothetical protein
MWDRRWQQRKGTRRTRPRMLLQDSANGSRGFVGVFLVRLRHPPLGRTIVLRAHRTPSAGTHGKDFINKIIYMTIINLYTNKSII